MTQGPPAARAAEPFGERAIVRDHRLGVPRVEDLDALQPRRDVPLDDLILERALDVLHEQPEAIEKKAA